MLATSKGIIQDKRCRCQIFPSSHPGHQVSSRRVQQSTPHRHSQLLSAPIASVIPAVLPESDPPGKVYCFRCNHKRFKPDLSPYTKNTIWWSKGSFSLKIKRSIFGTPCLPAAASLWISENAFRFPVIVTKIGLIVLLPELKKLRSSVSKLSRSMATTNHE